MPTLISTSVQEYSVPSRVKIGDRIYNNISVVDSRTFIDNDNRHRVVNYLTGSDAEYVSYLDNNKVSSSEKRYYKPITKKIGGKEYKNIVSSKYYADGSKVYINSIKPTSQNVIKIMPNGEVIDYSLLKKQSLKKLFIKPFENIYKSLKRIL